MTDAQQLFDFARRQFNGIADDVERHFELVAGQLREWMPSEITFVKPPPPRRLPPPTTLQIVQRWISRHRALTAAIVAFAITGSISAIVYGKNIGGRRLRRARKSASGARTDVVVVAGAVASPIASAIYLALERRGFVVYVVTETVEDEQYVRSQARLDLLPLRLDSLQPLQMEEQVVRFRELLSREHRAFDHAEPHRLNFRGLVLVPDTKADPARSDEIGVDEWKSAISGKIERVIATTQLFLPSLIEHAGNLLLLTPVVVPALRPPLHTIESTVYGALESYTAALAAELRSQGVGVSHFKLGDIDVPSVSAKQRREGMLGSSFKATPVRKLNDAVFDALMVRNPARTWHVGHGSLSYDLIGRLMPAGVVGWMMGARSWTNFARDKVDDQQPLNASAGSLTWEKIEQDGSELL